MITVQQLEQEIENEHAIVVGGDHRMCVSDDKQALGWAQTWSMDRESGICYIFFERNYILVYNYVQFQTASIVIPRAWISLVGQQKDGYMA